MECISYTVAVSSDHVTEIDFVLVVPSLNLSFTIMVKTCATYHVNDMSFS